MRLSAAQGSKLRARSLVRGKRDTKRSFHPRLGWPFPHDLLPCLESFLADGRPRKRLASHLGRGQVQSFVVAAWAIGYGGRSFIFPRHVSRRQRADVVRLWRDMFCYIGPVRHFLRRPALGHQRQSTFLAYESSAGGARALREQRWPTDEDQKHEFGATELSQLKTKNASV